MSIMWLLLAPMTDGLLVDYNSALLIYVISASQWRVFVWIRPYTA